jgi:glycosyltransferase involved in cell wall biosynthesis
MIAMLPPPTSATWSQGPAAGGGVRGLVDFSPVRRAAVSVRTRSFMVLRAVDMDQFTCRARTGSYLVFLGRISPEKGLNVAIRVARRAGYSIKIAAREPLREGDDSNARRDADDYQHVIQPLLREPGVEMIGQIGGRDKDMLLREAGALLVPDPVA